MSIIKIDKIVAAGCSFTYGDELENPQVEAWPALVAKNFNSLSINLGKIGASNEHISDNVLDYCVRNDTSNTFFIIMFSHHVRQTFCKTSNHNDISHISIHWTENYDQELKNILFSKYYNEIYLYRKTLKDIIMLQSFFKTNNFPYIMCNSWDNGPPDDKFLYPYYDLIDKNRFKEFNKMSFGSITEKENKLPKGHPNAKAHLKMANILSQWIENDYQIR